MALLKKRYVCMSLCVCMCVVVMWICVHGYIHICMLVCTHFCWHGYLSGFQLCWWSVTLSDPSAYAPSCLQALRLQTHMAISSFVNVDAGDLNSDPPTCTATALTHWCVSPIQHGLLKRSQTISTIFSKPISGSPLPTEFKLRSFLWFIKLFLL